MVWVDNGYNLIEWKQVNEFGHHTDCSFQNPDFVKLAESFGCAGFQVERSADLAPTIEKAFHCGKPAVIAVPVDYRENDRLIERIRVTV